MKSLYKIDGVGINFEKFFPVESKEEKSSLRHKYNFSDTDFILLYTAEFIKRKNHKLIFEIIPELKNEIKSVKIIFCGKGELLDYYKNLSNTKNYDFITFTGYTKNVADFCRLSDVLIMPSFQEGLPLSMIEACATSLPVVASKIRGHVDVIKDGFNGFLCDLNKKEDFVRSVNVLYQNPELRFVMGNRNVEVAKRFSVEIAVQKMAEIYKEVRISQNKHSLL